MQQMVRAYGASGEPAAPRAADVNSKHTQRKRMPQKMRPCPFGASGEHDAPRPQLRTPSTPSATQCSRRCTLAQRALYTRSKWGTRSAQGSRRELQVHPAQPNAAEDVPLPIGVSGEHAAPKAAAVNSQYTQRNLMQQKMYPYPLPRRGIKAAEDFCENFTRVRESSAKAQQTHRAF